MNGWRQHWQDGLLRGWEIGGQPEFQEKEDDVTRFNVEWKSFHMDELESDSCDEWYEDDGSLTPSRDPRSLFLSSLSRFVVTFFSTNPDLEIIFSPPPPHDTIHFLPSRWPDTGPLQHHWKAESTKQRNTLTVEDMRSDHFRQLTCTQTQEARKRSIFPKKLRGRNHDAQQTTFLETLLRYSTSCPTRSSLKSVLRRDTVTHQRRTLILQTKDQTKQLGQMRHQPSHHFLGCIPSDTTHQQPCI